MKKSIYVAGFESSPENGGVSGWEWRNNKEEAESIFDEWCATLTDCIVYKGEVEIEVANLSDGFEITELVEEYLDKNEYEKTFEDKVKL